MRVNTEQVIAAYGQKRAKRSCRSIWTNGVEIFSYGTRMLWSEADGTVCLNVRKYSVTTTTQQAGLRERFGGFAKLVNGATMEEGERNDRIAEAAFITRQQKLIAKREARQKAREDFKKARDVWREALKEYENAEIFYQGAANALAEVLSPAEMKRYKSY